MESEERKIKSEERKINIVCNIRNNFLKNFFVFRIGVQDGWIVDC
jgi:hypothetical protein